MEFQFQKILNLKILLLCVNIYWKIDNINNINKNEIKYKVEMREENKEYNKIYEGNNLNTLVNNLKNNTNYEFRICCIYKDDIGEWTENKKIKTKEFNSVILDDCQRKEEFIKLLKEWSGYKNMELIYRGTKDGGDNNNFHKKCDNQ